MNEVSSGVWLLKSFPPHGINSYLLGDVLVDAGTRHARRRILTQLRSRRVVAHALTHAHPDHQGASHALCQAFDLPLWCGTADADGMTRGDLSGLIPDNVVTRVQRRVWAGPAHPVTRQLREGDTVAGFTVIDVPGHSPGHVAFWREEDQVLILGDVLTNMHLVTGRVGLHEPPRLFTVDPALNRRSARKLAALRPKVVCFGHGPPLYDGAQFSAFVEQLAA